MGMGMVMVMAKEAIENWGYGQRLTKPRDVNEIGDGGWG